MSLASRIVAVVEAIGADMKARMLKTVTVSSEPAPGPIWGSASIDYATSGTSPPLLEAWYTGGTNDSSLASFWLNENGAPRASMPKAADSALKVVGWGTNQSGYTFEIQQRSGEGTGGRSVSWAIDAQGRPILGPSEVVGAHTVVIESTDTVPPTGTPAGTVVYKKRA